MKQLAYRIRRRLKRQYDKWRSIAKCHVRFGKHVLSYNSRYEGYNSVADYCVIRNCDIGYGTYFSPHCVADNTWIGKYCSVADDVTIGPGKFYVSSRERKISSIQKCLRSICLPNRP